MKFESVVVVAKPLNYVFVWGRFITFHGPWKGHDIVMKEVGFHHKHPCFKTKKMKFSTQGVSGFDFGPKVVVFEMNAIKIHQKLGWLSGDSVCGSHVARNY